MRLLPLILGIAVSQPMQAAPEVSHLLTGRLAQDIDAGGTQMLDLTWLPEIRWRFDDGARLTAIARLRWQPETGMRPEDMLRDSYAPVSRPALIGEDAELELRELYYEQPFDGGYLSLGKQQVVWGKADGLKVLDVVDPQSFREFILADFDQSRIPLWTLDAETTLNGPMGNDWTLQLLWIPDHTYHAMPKPDATFAFTSPRLVPQAPPGVTVRLDEPQRPGRLLRDSDAGVRLSGFVRGWDLSLNYLYQYDNQPALHRRFVPGPVPMVEITPRYHRTHVLGTSFSRAFGEWVFRGELGYFSRRSFLTDDPADTDGVAESAELSYVMGLDWSGIADTFVSGQLFQSRLRDYREGFTRPETDTSFSLLVRRRFWNETLTAELLWIANRNDGDGLVRPKIEYALQDNLEVWIGLDRFYGEPDGLFGQFDSNDRLVIGVEIGL